MTERERYWRDTAEMHARLTDHANLEADLIALDGVDLVRTPSSPRAR